MYFCNFITRLKINTTYIHKILLSIKFHHLPSIIFKKKKFHSPFFVEFLQKNFTHIIKNVNLTTIFALISNLNNKNSSILQNREFFVKFFFFLKIIETKWIDYHLRLNDPHIKTSVVEPLIYNIFIFINF